MKSSKFDRKNSSIMKNILFLILSFLFYSRSVVCYDLNSKEKNSKQPLPYFRRKVEEIFDETSPSVQTEDPNNIVSFLVQNVKEIFKDAYDDEDSVTHVDNHVTVIHNNDENRIRHLKSSLLFRPTVKNIVSLLSTEEPSYNTTRPMEEINDLIADILLPNSKIFHTNKTEDELDDTILNTTIGLLTYENNLNSPMPFLSNKKPSKDLLFLGKPERKVQKMKLVKVIEDDSTIDGLDNVTDSLMLYAADTELGGITTKRSCIICNNVAVDHCGNPKNKLIPSTLCSADEDLCYSWHTPFGIVDRGCFNINSNMTTYVCACNLCNYMSITGLPFIFASKQEWIKNVYELTHTKRLRGSVLKDILCLRCEANTTAGGDPDKNSDCLEGHVASLATQVCKENEICAVMAIKSQGYVWRGCVSFPLFNYYLTLCDSDLCNYDIVASVFDSD